MQAWSEYDAQLKSVVFASKLVKEANGTYEFIHAKDNVRTTMKWSGAIKRRGWIDYDDVSVTPELNTLIGEEMDHKVSVKTHITSKDNQEFMKLNTILRKLAEK